VRCLRLHVVTLRSVIVYVSLTFVYTHGYLVAVCFTVVVVTVTLVTVTLLFLYLRYVGCLPVTFVVPLRVVAVCCCRLRSPLSVAPLLFDLLVFFTFPSFLTPYVHTFDLPPTVVRFYIWFTFTRVTLFWLFGYGYVGYWFAVLVCVYVRYRFVCCLRLPRFVLCCYVVVTWFTGSRCVVLRLPVTLPFVPGSTLVTRFALL